MLLLIFSIKKGILVIYSPQVHKQSSVLAYPSKRLFKPEFCSQRSINMIKVLSFRCQQCFGQFVMLLVEGPSETRLFRHLSNHVFNRLAMRVFFFNKMFKTESKRRKCKTKNKKLFFVSEIIVS